MKSDKQYTGIKDGKGRKIYVGSIVKRASDTYVVEAPLSYAGSARRIWRINHSGWFIALELLLLIPLAWTAVTAWYLLFGLLLVPYRLIRRSQRKQKLEQLRHRELLGKL